MKFSLYPPLVAFAVFETGVALLSIPLALIVGGLLGLAAWLAFFVCALRQRAS